MDNTVTVLPDGSAFATASWPLPKDHWLYRPGANVPPMPLRMGTDNPERQAMNKAVWAAAKYAVRCATLNGTEPDFDPDALCQSMVVGLLGYHTADGLSSDLWDNPPTPVPMGQQEREHISSADCWCGPTVDYTDPDTGCSVYVHKRAQ